MAHDRKSRLQEFVDWAAAHITGDEKGEAQIFLDRLLQAFSQKGLLEVGGKAEFRIRKAKEDGGGTAFADYAWKSHVRSIEATKAVHFRAGVRSVRPVQITSYQMRRWWHHPGKIPRLSIGQRGRFKIGPSSLRPIDG